jgi:hypothetical protein
LGSGPVTLSQVVVAGVPTEVATLTVSTLPPGTTDNIIAQYSGDTNFVNSGSGVETVSVNSPDYTVSANPNSVTLAAGQKNDGISGDPPPITITVTPNLTYTGTVTFSCAGLPVYITCAFIPTSGSLPLVFNNSTAPQTLTLIVTVGSASGMLERRGPVMLAIAMPLGLLGLLPFVGKNRKRLRLCLAIVGLALTLGGAIAGCSSAGSSTATSNLPPVGAQSFAVTAAGSSSSGTTSHQLQLTINITN